MTATKQIPKKYESLLPLEMITDLDKKLNDQEMFDLFDKNGYSLSLWVLPNQTANMHVLSSKYAGDN